MFKKYGYIVRCGWSDEEMGTAGLPKSPKLPELPKLKDKLPLTFDKIRRPAGTCKHGDLGTGRAWIAACNCVFHPLLFTITRTPTVSCATTRKHLHWLNELGNGKKHHCWLERNIVFSKTD